MFSTARFVQSALSSVTSVAAATVLLGAAAASAEPQAAAAPAKPQSCFFVTEWQGWKSPSPKVLYLGVSLHDVYRVDLAAASPELQWPDARLISVVRGGNTVCSAIDLDLSVSNGEGFKEPLFPVSITRLSPSEVAAIPAKYRP